MFKQFWRFLRSRGERREEREREREKEREREREYDAECHEKDRARTTAPCSGS